MTDFTKVAEEVLERMRSGPLGIQSPKRSAEIIAAALRAAYESGFGKQAAIIRVMREALEQAASVRGDDSWAHKALAEAERIARGQK